VKNLKKVGKLRIGFQTVWRALDHLNVSTHSAKCLGRLAREDAKPQGCDLRSRLSALQDPTGHFVTLGMGGTAGRPPTPASTTDDDVEDQKGIAITRSEPVPFFDCFLGHVEHCRPFHGHGTNRIDRNIVPVKVGTPAEPDLGLPS
jgi:hypothetical protein